ncbi:hypothetical protein Tco_0539468 [Tanacetum coccineum]
MGKSTETLWLLTKEQKAFRDNLCKSGLGYNGPCVLLQAYAKIPKLYRAYELRDENEQLHVFDSEDTLEDAERSRLKMNEFQKDEKVQARNKDLHDETERISKESKDVSNESKTADTVCNDAFEVTQELSKRIVELEKDISKFEAKSSAFEILEHRVESLNKENEHLMSTYQSLFDSIKKSRVQTKTSNVTQNEAENLKSQLFEFAETMFNNIFGKIEFFKKNVFADEEKRATLVKLNAFDKENCDFGSKVTHLEKIIAQKSKYFDDVKLELSNRTANFEA